MAAQSWSTAGLSAACKEPLLTPDKGVEEVDLLVLGSFVLTMDAHDRVFEDGGVAVRAGEIVAVGPRVELEGRYRPAETLCGGRRVLMPGLVDTYAHAGHGMIRGLFHPDHGWPAGELYWHATSERWWYAEALLAATERLRCGVTTGVSVVGATPARCDSPVFAEQGARAYAETGVRVVLGVGPPDPLFSHLEEPWSGSFLEGGHWVRRNFSYRDALQSSLETVRNWHGAAGGLVEVALAPPYLFGRHVEHRRRPQRLPTAEDAPDMLARAEELRGHADRYGIQLHTHMFRGSVSFALKYFGAGAVSGLLGPDVVIAHANGLLEPEVTTLGAAGCAVATVAYTHENLWYGLAPIPELIEAGATVTISSDGAAPYTSLDLWRELPRALWNQWLIRGNERILPPGVALRMVTVEAARALGLGDRIGSLEVGKRADLIAVDLDRPHLVSGAFTPRLLVHYATGQDVGTVIVDGRVLLRDGRPTRIDPAEIASLAREEATLALERLGVDEVGRYTQAFWNARVWKGADA